MSEPLRTCNKCGVEANTEEELLLFVKVKVGSHGRAKICTICHNTRQAGYRNSNPDYKREKLDYDLNRKYGITLTDYDDLLESQGGVCSICSTDDTGYHKRFVVDHCHTTGEVRGLLCNPCNIGLGHFKDNQSVLLEAVQYLIRTNKETTNV